MNVLDTNVVIHFLKGDPGIVKRITDSSRTDVAIPDIVGFELECGTLRSGFPERRRRALELGLGHFARIPFDTRAAASAAQIRAALEKNGIVIGPLDVLIAGTALSRGATLITNNVAEFSRVPGLKTRDWRTMNSSRTDPLPV